MYELTEDQEESILANFIEANQLRQDPSIH